ncbi:DUF2795 domain-containing protein [Pseudonocardia endophytica]|uniref:Uncharacterized protein DUF2795 n=1 Tax=Pseudonocardia endophytica TaxID=401976 RepID=A0A4R1HGT0_PSEEN|nr:DUF2795 domain-containing protein [Pseudonocardia endophytica]TCK21377.1 uncharacterized protein DUF2795 [Pseudonocardia endophytica]
MTRRDDARVEKALQGADFPAGKQDLLDYAQTRDAGEETLQGLRALPDREFANLRDAVDAVPQEPEGSDVPGGTERVPDI